jgi:hypothetical protein
MKDNIRCGMIHFKSLITGKVSVPFVLAQGFYAFHLFPESFAYLFLSFRSFRSFRKLKKAVENSLFKKMWAFIKKWNDHYYIYLSKNIRGK